jgi:endogenous inhibitor of DNA gyrase (YacG/DUF329 family)
MHTKQDNKHSAVVHCPTCKKPVQWNSASRWKPFCSKRCSLIDLGEWFDEKPRIPDTTEQPDHDEY